MNDISRYIFVHSLLSITEDEIFRKTTIRNIAEKSGYSQRYVQHIFKLTTGISLGNYIRRRKLYHAAIQLCFSNMPLIDISTQLGFSSQSAFNRAFTGNFNISPLAYRKRKILTLGDAQPRIHVFKENDRDIPVLRFGEPKNFKLKLIGRKFSYRISTAKFSSKHYRLKEIMVDRFLKCLDAGFHEYYIVSKATPCESTGDFIKIDCFVGVKDDNTALVKAFEQKSLALDFQNCVQFGFGSVYPHPFNSTMAILNQLSDERNEGWDCSHVVEKINIHGETGYQYQIILPLRTISDR
ncbi:helix-turn-helix transcriptional regulator [Citrobacter koseri]|uniref:helix-turn-helix transcriptional regulator n=1 Tax=Citrobacter koseri TaxID=545 RepID=UPI0023B05B78|nr:helix-turn-helix transcriptional regulator [Citrobacter koseri]